MNQGWSRLRDRYLRTTLAKLHRGDADRYDRLTTIAKLGASEEVSTSFRLRSVRHEPQASEAPQATRPLSTAVSRNRRKGIEGEAYDNTRLCSRLWENIIRCYQTTVLIERLCYSVVFRRGESRPVPTAFEVTQLRSPRKTRFQTIRFAIPQPDP